MCGLVSPPLTLISIDGSMEKVMVSSVHCRYIPVHMKFILVSIEDFILLNIQYRRCHLTFIDLQLLSFIYICASAVLSLYPLELKVHTI